MDYYPAKYQTLEHVSTTELYDIPGKYKSAKLYLKKPGREIIQIRTKFLKLFETIEVRRISNRQFYQHPVVWKAKNKYPKFNKHSMTEVIQTEMAANSKYIIENSGIGSRRASDSRKNTGN